MTLLLVLYQCALKQDLTLFEAGDKTEVGEKGLTLSGGQKARVTLARAVYSSAEILLLDDVLAALDVHTAKWIVNKCFRGDLITGRTVLLVVSIVSSWLLYVELNFVQTHNVTLTTSLADFVVTLGSNGQVSAQDSIPEALMKDAALAEEVEEEEEEVKKEEEVVDGKPEEEGKKKPAGKLVLAEEIAIGSVSWASCEYFVHTVRTDFESRLRHAVHEVAGRGLFPSLLDPVLVQHDLRAPVHDRPNLVPWLLGTTIRGRRPDQS